MTYTLVYKSIPRNLSGTTQAALMKSSAPLDGYLGPWAVAGLDFVSDTPSVSGVNAVRTVVVADAGTPGAIPPGQSMVEFLTNILTGSIATGIVTPVTADPVVAT